MELMTRDFGKIEIDKREIIHFPQGIPGFLEQKDYVLIKLAEDSPFVIIQSVEEKGLAFLTISPWKIIEDYEFELDEHTEKLLKIDSAKDILILVISTIHEGLEDMTVNLAAPLIINYCKHLGKQLILEGSKYVLKHPAFPGQIRQGAE